MKIYEVNQASLIKFSSVGVKSLPPDSCRKKGEEFAGSDEGETSVQVRDIDLNHNRFA